VRSHGSGSDRGRRARGRRWFGAALLACVVFVGAFLYGYASRSRDIFPHPFIRRTIHAVDPAHNVSRAAASKGIPGRWYPFRTTAPGDSLTPEQREEMERLLAIGYLSGTTAAPDVSGVTFFDEERASPGLNFFVSGHGPEATLMTMDGEVLHRWRRDFWSVWPDPEVAEDDLYKEYWRRAHLYENGDVLAIFDWRGMVKIDRDSNLIWAYPGNSHHDIFVTEDGTIYILDQEALVLPRISEDHPVLDNSIAVLAPDGTVERRVSILEAFENSPYAPVLERMPDDGDIFHTNAIEVLDGSLSEVSPAFRAGNVLICVRSLDTIAVVDLDSEQVVWVLTGRWKAQHQSTVVPGGRMLVFNNEAGDGGSEVIDLDPFTQEVHWSYRGGPVTPFYSATCGSNQRLPNGNTLITETDNGRAFEVTPGGDIVWEFVNPHRAGDDDELIASLFEVVRLPADFPLDWLDVRE